MSPEIARAIGRIPGGCSILTVRSGADRTGMLVSWVQQAAFEPPTVSVAVKSGRPIADLIDKARGFTLNLLGENPGPMFKHFGKGFAPGEEAFAGLETTDVEFGVAIPDRIAVLSCKLVARQKVGDHDVLFGEVVEAAADESLPPPYVHIRKSGANY
ncbi:MAG: flavin reductase family protein [Phycisphaerales bacterium]|nr:flavin reductase family protein [Phycisphaerales bacterium]MCB9856755.1 flavin reductase family protein [Phycisphaerales bacterium]MCB9862118.1 flavin reductase family protein [Phycisphaerales bacterium]